MSEDKFKPLISIIGRPTWVTTFMNKVLGQKIAIMSDKPQTTRNKQGVHATEDSQMIFIDTPGIHNETPAKEYMMKVA